MTLLHLIVVALVQGVTEYLPISSSGHLILIPALTDWPDQGARIDVAAHVGSLGAVLVYFRADVAGYSRLMGDDERATLETLDAYSAVFSDSIVKHDGRVVDMAGDSLLTVFDSVVEAVIREFMREYIEAREESAENDKKRRAGN